MQESEKKTMNQNEVLLSGETGPVGSIGAGPAERIQSEQETALEEQTETGTASTEQTDPAFRWDKIATWPPDVAIFFIVAGTALCLLRVRRTQFELWFGKTGYLYGNILLLVISLFVLCLFLYRGCRGEF